MEAGEKLWSQVDLQKFNQMFADTTNAAMVITDTLGVIVWCNARLTEIYEEPESEIIGSHLGNRVIYPKGVNINIRLQHAIEHGYTKPLKTKWVTKSGKIKFLHQRIYRLDDHEGNNIGFWGAAYELTKEMKAIDESKTAIRVFTKEQKDQIQEKQLDVIEMIKMQSDALCPGKSIRGDYCPAILAVEKAIQGDQVPLKLLLTKTEHIIAAHTKKRMSIKNISIKLNISERTVQNHRHSIRKKLNIAKTKIPLTEYLQNYPI